MTGEIVRGEVVNDESVNISAAAFFTAIFAMLFKDNAIFGELFFVRIEEVFRLLSSCWLCFGRAVGRAFILPNRVLDCL